MIAATWSQMAAVIRIEIAKTFFSKRSLWIYLLALLPAGLFFINSIYSKREHERLAKIAIEHPIPKGALRQIRPFSSIEQVTQILGEPYRIIVRNFSFGNPPQKHERRTYFYTDGESETIFNFDNGYMQFANRGAAQTLSNLLLIFASVFQLYFIRLAIFFGCAGIFTNLFRGEMIDKSLHFYLLAPVPRPVLVMGKFIAGLSATALIFAASTALQLAALLRGFDSASVHEYLNSGGGWHHIAAYIGVSALACLVYGSIFLAFGLIAKNPAVPAALLLLWESANSFIPGSLKMASVVFYLQSLCPVEAPPDRTIPVILQALVAPVQRVSTSTGILVMIAVAAAVLLFSSLKARQLEINYSAD
jgi:ABC-type transport system involved in multi-copper enzyme maturation permease subunit